MPAGGLRPLGAACGAVLALAGGCGGGDDERGDPRPDGPRPASSPRQFAERFARVTGVALTSSPDDLVGVRLEVPAEPNRFARLGTYSLVWTEDAADRREALRGARRPGPRGIRWRRSGATYSAVKAFGGHLVLDWTGGERRRTNAQWGRLARAVRAAYLGRPELLPPPERPCRRDPLTVSAGACSVRGLPVTVVDGDEPLDAAPFTAEVRGVETRDQIRPRYLPAERARGTFVVVAYRLQTKTLIRSVTTQLRVGRRVFEEAPASVFLPRSRLFPIPPAATYRARAAFDVPRSLTARLNRRGAFVLPVEIDELGDPSSELAQGWIRLRGAGEKGQDATARDASSRNSSATSRRIWTIASLAGER